MTVDITYLMELKSNILNTTKAINTLTEQLNTQVIKLQKNCNHPTVIIDRHYSSGGYDHLSSVTITQTCTVCGKVLRSYDDPNHHGTHG